MESKLVFYLRAIFTEIQMNFDPEWIEEVGEVEETLEDLRIKHNLLEGKVEVLQTALSEVVGMLTHHVKSNRQEFDRIDEVIGRKLFETNRIR